MKDTKDITVVVRDFGMFMPLALKLAEQVKKVYYSTPYEKGFVELDDCILGDGMATIERLDDILSPSVFDGIDLYCFPYILDSGLQEHLVQSGKAVWGARRADELETKKGLFFDTLKSVGLPVPEHRVITGLTKLREHLRENNDLYIKVSRFRGLMDTWHHVNYSESRSYLDLLACKLGPFQEKIKFYVIKPIRTPIEGGIDTYCIDGQWPDTAVLGYEAKNECYLAVVKPMAEMPEEYRLVNEAMGPVLAEYNYRQFFSSEVRVRNGKSYFIDATCRHASPAGEELLELYGNIGDIVWHGANGELIQPEITAKFAGEALIHWTGDKKEWRSLRVPEEIRRRVTLYGCAEADGVFYWPPDDEEVIGCLVGVGDTPSEVIEQINEAREELGDAQIKVDMAAFAKLTEEIEAAEDKGIEFSDEPLPEPAELLTNGE